MDVITKSLAFDAKIHCFHDPVSFHPSLSSVHSRLSRSFLVLYRSTHKFRTSPKNPSVFWVFGCCLILNGCACTPYACPLCGKFWDYLSATFKSNNFNGPAELYEVGMQKPKELFKEIFIAAGGGWKRQLLSSPEAKFPQEKDKTIHPPIESHWHLLPPNEYKGYTGSKDSLKGMLSYPLKLWNSLRLRKSQSTKMVFEGVRSPKDEEMVDSFRELLLLEGHQPGKHYDYHTLLRFLRMRDFNLMKAKDMFLSYLKWREEFGVDTIAKELSFEEYSEIKKCHPHGFHGVDRFGRPIYIERIGIVDVNALLQITTIERFVKHHVSEQEKTLNWRYPACSLAAKKHIASTTSILDVKDVGISNFSKPARNLFVEIQKINSNYYPETLNRLFIINAGSGFKVLWTAIKAFLEPRTISKIKVLGSNYLCYLIEVIDPSNLPTFLGGSCTCSDSGGCLLSDKGPWTDPEITSMLQATIASGEESEDREKTYIPAPEGYVANTDIVQVKDVYDTTQTRDDSSERLTETSIRNQPSTRKIEVFEALLNVAKRKIETLEAVLEDTKLVLQRLAEHMEELKRN